MQRNKQVAMGRKKFNMDPKKVSEEDTREPCSGGPGVPAWAHLPPAEPAGRCDSPTLRVYWQQFAGRSRGAQGTPPPFFLSPRRLGASQACTLSPRASSS